MSFSRSLSLAQNKEVSLLVGSVRGLLKMPELELLLSVNKDWRSVAAAKREKKSTIRSSRLKIYTKRVWERESEREPTNNTQFVAIISGNVTLLLNSVNELICNG